MVNVCLVGRQNSKREGPITAWARVVELGLLGLIKSTFSLVKFQLGLLGSKISSLLDKVVEGLFIGVYINMVHGYVP